MRGIHFISFECIAEPQVSQIHAFNFIAHLITWNFCEEMFCVSMNGGMELHISMLWWWTFLGTNIFIKFRDQQANLTMRFWYSLEVSAVLNLCVCLFWVPNWWHISEISSPQNDIILMCLFVRTKLMKYLGNFIPLKWYSDFVLAKPPTRKYHNWLLYKVFQSHIVWWNPILTFFSYFGKYLIKCLKYKIFQTFVKLFSSVLPISFVFTCFGSILPFSLLNDFTLVCDLIEQAHFACFWFDWAWPFSALAWLESVTYCCILFYYVNSFFFIWSYMFISVSSLQLKMKMKMKMQMQKKKKIEKKRSTWC